MKQLRISDTLSLPLNYATKTAAILAQRRKGKTYTASVIAEEMVAAKQPFVALDPTGAWWGLRASADGKAAGLPVIILGGQHGDVALERTGGRVVADLVVDEPGFYVIDFSLFESGEAERQFAVDFAERLYRAKAQPGKNFPLHLFVDEADRFIPQNLSNKSETSPRLLGAFEAIVRRGGLRGLGTTLISQRAAVVNKNVLEMLDVLFALRTLGPNDQKAIKGYVSAHGSEAELAAISGSLASLAIGEAWVWEPGAEPALFERVQIRQRTTFNSSATPDAAHRPVDPKQLAAVDLEALNKRMADTIQRAKADDPKELRKRVLELEGELRKKSVEVIPTGTKAPTQILTAADLELLERLAKKLDAGEEMLRTLSERCRQTIEQRIAATVNTGLLEMEGILDRGRTVFAKVLQDHRLPALMAKLEQLSSPAAPRFHPTEPSTSTYRTTMARPPARPPIANGSRSTPAAAASGLTAGQQSIIDILDVLERRGIVGSIESLSAWLDLHPNGGTFRGNIRRLAEAGYLNGYELTDVGRGAARGLATGLQPAKDRLTGGQVAVLEAIELSPKPLDIHALAAALNTHPNGGTFRGSVRRLMKMGLITGGQMRLTEGARR